MSRRRLPNRRPSMTFGFQHHGLSFTVAASLFEDGRPAEMFLRLDGRENDVSALARDAAILVSFALQYPSVVYCRTPVAMAALAA